MRIRKPFALGLVAVSTLAALWGCGGSGGGDFSVLRMVVGTDSRVAYTDNGQKVQNLLTIWNLRGWNSVYYGVRTPDGQPLRIAQAVRWKDDVNVASRVWLDTSQRPWFMRPDPSLELIQWFWESPTVATLRTTNASGTQIGLAYVKFGPSGYTVSDPPSGNPNTPSSPPPGQTPPGVGSRGRDSSAFTTLFLKNFSARLGEIHASLPSLRRFMLDTANGLSSGQLRENLKLNPLATSANEAALSKMFGDAVNLLPTAAQFDADVASAAQIGTTDDF